MKNDNPNCLHYNCFACEQGHCRVLIQKRKEPCPFFKTEEQLAAEHKKTRERLKRYKRLCRYDKYDN